MENPSPEICKSAEEMRSLVQSWRASGETIALVPTMGALHRGHLSLVSEAREKADRVVVSIFVNPTQFAEGEDFEDYPRTWDDDLKALEPFKVDAIYAPTAKVMYPDGFATTVEVAGPALDLETAHRPHFFKGVATVVSKLLLGVLPDIAIFGEKDYQQLLVIKQMTRDLQIPSKIIGSPTLREDDGLAMSSRNQYLSDKDRGIAAKLHETLQTCAQQVRENVPISDATSDASRTLTSFGFDVDYVEIRHAETLEAVDDHSTNPLRLLAAARLGTTRLIDNIAV